MGIKNFHILLIFAAAFICILFGVWGLQHESLFLSCLSFIVAVGLIVYGINFIKKVKVLLQK